MSLISIISYDRNSLSEYSIQNFGYDEKNKQISFNEDNFDFE